MSEYSEYLYLTTLNQCKVAIHMLNIDEEFSSENIDNKIMNLIPRHYHVAGR